MVRDQPMTLSLLIRGGGVTGPRSQELPSGHDGRFRKTTTAASYLTPRAGCACAVDGLR